MAYHRTADAEAIHRYWAGQQHSTRRMACVVLRHAGLSDAASSIRRALRPLLPHNTADYGEDALHCTRRWDMEAELDALRARFPKLRYHMIEVSGQVDHARGAHRVHINKRFKKVVTLRARRQLSF